MTEERKEELRQLLNKAMENLVILPFGGDGSLLLPMGPYREYLQQRWTTYGVDSSHISTLLRPYIVSQATESRLLEFIRSELAAFIHEDKIRSASYAIEGDATQGFYLYHQRSGLLQLRILLEHLLRIAIARGIEEAVSIFNKSCCPEGMQGFYQDIVSLEGIKIETEIQVYEGIRLVPFPDLTPSKLGSYLPGFLIRDFGSKRHPDTGKTLLTIERPLFYKFHKPSEEPYQRGIRTDELPFHFELNNVKLPNNNAINSFRKSFCWVLSLVCNSSVQIASSWQSLPEDELFHPLPGGGIGRSFGPFGRPTNAGHPQIEEAKCLDKIWKRLDSNVKGKLQIAIDRWIKSKANKDPVDQMIDLGIALESLYLSGTESKNEIRFRFSLHAAWHLGEDKEHREGLMKKFKAIYDWRSAVVHTGKLPKKGTGKKKKSYTQEEVREFIRNAQDLGRNSIIKILEDGEFPDWKDLILG